jgi:hypothetical protein
VGARKECELRNNFVHIKSERNTIIWWNMCTNLWTFCIVHILYERQFVIKLVYFLISSWQLSEFPKQIYKTTLCIEDFDETSQINTMYIQHQKIRNEYSELVNPYRFYLSFGFWNRVVVRLQICWHQNKCLVLILILNAISVCDCLWCISWEHRETVCRKILSLRQEVRVRKHRYESAWSLFLSARQRELDSLDNKRLRQIQRLQTE